jgi:hypothetical protein
MNKAEIISTVQSTIHEFQGLISSFDEMQINTVPFEGSWTPGQVAQHIIMASSGFGKVLNGPAIETQRAPDELQGRIKQDFLNFGIKMKSPDFILPRLKDYDKQRLLNALEGIKDDVVKSATDLDLTQTCMAFELPVYGKLTRFEAVYFLIYHTQRHAHQLKKIKDHFDQN